MCDFIIYVLYPTNKIIYFTIPDAGHEMHTYFFFYYSRNKHFVASIREYKNKLLFVGVKS